MSFQLYVGNYPTEFSRNDVEAIFREFDGIKVDRFFKKANKSYSFLICKDMDQVVSVIQQMNNTTVSGRTLKVRASDVSLQKYVELLLQETSDDTETSQKTVVDANPKKSPREKCHGANAGGFSQEGSHDRNAGRFPLEKSYEANREKFPLEKSYEANREKFPQGKSSVETLPSGSLQVLRKKACEKSTDEQFEVNSYHSSNPSLCSNCDENNYNGTAHCSKLETISSRSSYSNSSFLHRHDEGFSEFVWVSITNFPLGTNKSAIYDLFGDYKPIKIKMICNEARRDRTLTEAHVCFFNRDIADDVILNFDNTMFHGRLLLVNDIEDLTIMNELVNVVHS